MKNFKQYIIEAKKKTEHKENIEGGDMSKPYRIPAEIRDLMNRHDRDDTYDWGNFHTIHDQGVLRGAESIEHEEEELTPARKAEIERSRQIQRSIEGTGVNLDPTYTTGRSDGHLFSNDEIAKIFNARGERTSRGTPFSKQVIDLIAKGALEKIKKGVMK
jgi:hypothetical protein